MARFATAGATLVHVVLLLLLLLSTATCDDDDSSAFVYAGCSQGRYDAGSRYASGVDSVLTSVANSAPYHPLRQLHSSLRRLDGRALPVPLRLHRLRPLRHLQALFPLQLGHRRRRAAARLLRAVRQRLVPREAGHHRPVQEVWRCAGGAAMRDSALGAAAAPAGGGYLAGGSGGVQAMSQYVGDLGAKACSDCVSTAAGQLKTGCGYASAGEVYFGKCYARFWGNGGGGFSSGADQLRASPCIRHRFLCFLGICLTLVCHMTTFTL
jgi:hypothetical protein